MTWGLRKTKAQEQEPACILVQRIRLLQRTYELSATCPRRHRQFLRLANRLLMKAWGGNSASRHEKRVQVYGRTFWGRDQSLFNTFFSTCHSWDFKSNNFFPLFFDRWLRPGKRQRVVGVRVRLRVVRLYSPTVCLRLFFCDRGCMSEAGQHQIQYHNSRRNEDGF